MLCSSFLFYASCLPDSLLTSYSLHWYLPLSLENYQLAVIISVPLSLRAFQVHMLHSFLILCSSWRLGSVFISHIFLSSLFSSLILSPFLLILLGTLKPNIHWYQNLFNFYHFLSIPFYDLFINFYVLLTFQGQYTIYNTYFQSIVSSIASSIQTLSTFFVMPYNFIWSSHWFE